MENQQATVPIKTTVENQVLDILNNHEIDLVLSVPCGKMQSFLSIIPKKKSLSLSRESVGVGIAAGAYMGGAKPLLLIQNTGLGNSIINIASLNMNYNFPLPMLLSWRGRELENIKAQNVFGNVSPAVLKSIEVPFWVVKQKSDMAYINQAIEMAYQRECATACLISPVFWDAPPSHIHYTTRNTPKRMIIQKPTEESKIVLSRYKAIDTVLNYLKENDPKCAIITNLGIPSKEAYDVSKKTAIGLNIFYMLAGFGEVSSIGLGVAMFSDKNIYVLDGDGSLFHNPNVFDAIVSVMPKNLTIIALDNGVHSSTGNQMTCSHLQIDLETIALAYGFSDDCTSKVYTANELTDFLQQTAKGPRFVHTLVKRGNADVGEVDISCEEIKANFMNHLLE